MGRLGIIVCLLLSTAATIEAYSTGAPAAACTRIYPEGHNRTSQNLQSSPFLLDISQLYNQIGNIYYTPGYSYKLTLTGGNFKGFLIQARSSVSATPLGKFSVSTNGSQQLSQCSPPESAVTHTDNSVKNNVSLTWTAPAIGSGPIVFLYTVVVRYSAGVSTFYATLNTTTIQEGCADPLYLNGSTCMASCPPYYYGNYTSRLCLPLPNSYTTMFNATYYKVSFLNTTPVGSILIGFTLYIDATAVPVGSSVYLSITGNIGLGIFASDYFYLLSAHSYIHNHAINSASDYVVTDQIYYNTQTNITTFTFNLQSFVPPSQIVGANNVGVTIIDICQANPCHNGGTCVYIRNSTTTCTCAPGFNGTNCSNDIKYCTPTTCLNGGTCYDGYGTYTNCTCAPGFNGKNCSNDINYCTPTTCLNGGTCYDGHGTLTNCTCAPGFSGTNCSNDLNHCIPTTCLNGGTCVEGSGTSTSCVCATGTNGPNCITTVCSLTYGAGVIWNEAYANQMVLMPCSDADTTFSNVTQMSRQCLPSGQWGAVDFTTCTLRSGVSRPFTMYWSSLVNESSLNDVGSVRNSTPGININFNVINISSSFGIFSQFGSSLFSILISANFNDQQLSEYYPYILSKKRQAVPSIPLSYAVIRPSDPCSCKPSLGNQFYLCSNVQSSPCNCKNASNCQCLPPFVGDGELCTIDSDLDGVPDTPLNCTGYTYCMEDNCPYIYNPPINGVQRDVCHGMLKASDGCSPVNDTVWGLQWPGTALNSTYVLPCPQGGIDYVAGWAYRFCNSTGDWVLTDVTQCESYTIRYLAQKISSPSHDITQNLGIVNSLFLETQPNHISILPLDLRDSVYILSTMLTLLNTNLQQGGGTDVLNTMIILDVINNLLNQTNLAGWQILQTVYPNTSALLLKASESYGLYLASAINTTSTITLSRSSIVLQASKVQITPNQADIKFPDGNGDLFLNATFSAGEASIIIPGALLLERGKNASSVPVANMIINNIATFLPSNGSSIHQVDSLVLSSQVAVEDGGFGSLVLKNRPAMISFSINSQNNLTTQYQCSFWNFSNSSWSSEGMLPPSSNGSFVQCYSTHLTSFAVLLAVETFPDSKALTIISYIGCGISMACLLVTIIFFLTFRKQLLEKPLYFIHLNLAIALFLAFLIFIAGVETAKNNVAACKAVAALLQYFWLSAFCWMMCEGVMLYLMLVVVFSTLQKKWWFFFLLGWVPALIFVVIGLAVRSDYYVVRKDDTTISYCWMSTEKGTIWAFAAPVVLILLVNILFLIMVLVVLFKRGRADVDKNNKTAVVSMLKATITLLPILGCTWIFGLLSVNQYTLVFTWLFTILNSLQGFFIFICYVLRDEKIWGKIVKKYEALSTSNRSDQTKLKSSQPSQLENKCNIYSDLKSSEGIILECGNPNEYSEVYFKEPNMESSQFTNITQADVLY